MKHCDVIREALDGGSGRGQPMTDLDYERADKIAHAWREPGRAHWSKCASDLARCYQASRAREARLEALVRSLGKCRACKGHCSDCDDCAGTGLVEAARKELSP